MRYFLNTAQQVKNDDGTIADFGKKETKGTGDSAKTNAISELHASYATQLKTAKTLYWMGKVEDCEGNVLDRLECGIYIDTELQPQPDNAAQEAGE